MRNFFVMDFHLHLVSPLYKLLENYSETNE